MARAWAQATRSWACHRTGCTPTATAWRARRWPISTGSAPLPELGCSPIEALLIPHRSYLEPIAQLREAGIDLRGIAHITGGGVIENLPRALPVGCSATIKRGTWPEPPIFGLIQQRGEIEPGEMFEVV